MPAVEVTINDIDKTSEIRASSIAFTRPKRGRATGNFTSNVRYQLGQKVGIFHNGVRRFGGTIDEIRDVAPAGASGALHSTTLDYEYLLVGWEQRLDNRLVPGVAYGGVFVADAGTDKLTQYGHRLTDGKPVHVATTGTLPAGLSTSTTYYVRDSTTNDFKLAATLGGAAINITDAGTGVHRLLWRSGDLIRSVVTEFAAGESVDLSGVSNGIFVEKQVFDYVSVMAAIQSIADQTTGYTLFIDPTLILVYRSGTAAAPFNITSTSSNAFNLDVIRETREDYRNRENLRLSDTDALRTTETFTGDGSSKYFWLAGPASIVRSVSDGTTEYSLGIDGVDSDVDFYWSQGSHLIRQDSAGTAIGSGVTLTVIYSTFENTVVLVQDTGEQSARAAIEGGSGVYERIGDAPGGSTVDTAERAAQADLDAYGIARAIEYQTLNTAIEPGMDQTVTFAAHGLSAAPFVIEDVSFAVEQGLMVCSVTATDARLRGVGEVFSSFQGGSSLSGGVGAVSGGGSGTIPDPPQVASGDWSIAATEYREYDGQQWMKLSITIVSVPSGAPADAYPTLHIFKTADPATGAPVYGQGGPDWNWANFTQPTMEVWVRRESADFTAYCFLSVNSKNSVVPPTASFAYKTVTILAIGSAPHSTSFSVSVVSVNAGGVPSGKFQAVFTPPNEPSLWDHGYLERIACSSLFVANAGASYEPVMDVRKPSGWTNGTAVTVTQGETWARPPAVEYWIFRLSAVAPDGAITRVFAPTSNVTVSANSGLNLGSADPTTAGSGLSVTGGLIFIPTNGVDNGMLQNLIVDASKLANSAVTSTKIANLAVGTAAIQDLAVTSAKVNDLAANKITAGTISAAVSMTSPSLTITGASWTANIDSTNGLKVTGSTYYTQMDSGVLKVAKISGGSQRVQISGYPEVTLYNSAGTAVGFYEVDGADAGKMILRNSSGVERIEAYGTNGELWLGGSSAKLYINGNQILGVRQSDSGATSVTVPSSGSNTADSASGDLYNAVVDLQNKLNAMRTVLRNHGLMS